MGRMKCFLGMALVAVGANAQTAGKICNLAFQVCPKTLEGTTINVPEDVIWLEPQLPFCTEEVRVQTGTTAPAPSIMFIIDNSGSMNNNDPQEARFSVTTTLLDSIFKANPATQVGLSIFTRRLSFDHRENPFFMPAFPGDTSQHDSYVPLTALNHAFPNGRTGLDTMKSLLTVVPGSNNGDLLHATKLPESRANTSVNNDPPGSPPNSEGKYNVRDGTDITLGFEAARQAMKASTAAPANQYFIFLSDGEPSQLDVGRVGIKETEFVQGTATPTTFTVYFNSNSNAPDVIEDMTENIRANNYSASNPKSNHWAINLPATQLLGLLQSNVLNPIFANRPATPASATLVTGGTTLNNSALNANSFVFPSRVPLAPNQTSIALTYNYTYVDSGKTKTHQATYNVNIRRVPAGTPPTGVTTICKDPGDISLSHNGTPVNLVTADHEKLDVKLTLPNGEVCANCTVTVQPNTNRSGKDNEGVSVTAPPGSGSYTGSFGRETSTTPAANDGKLQHLPTDSIVVTWVNPLNPLEVIRKAFPYSDVRTALQVVNHNTVSKADNSIPADQRTQWVLVGSSTVKITTEEGPADCCRLVPTMTPQDSSKYVGIKVTASRSFRVEVKVYDNLGQFVNKLTFSVSQAEFTNLAREGLTGNNRSIRVLWDSRTVDGAFAGTGAYVFKTTVTLNKIPGIAEDEVVRTDHRLVGVVRDR